MIKILVMIMIIIIIKYDDTDDHFKFDDGDEKKIRRLRGFDH